MNLAQLRKVAETLGTTPSDILFHADQLAGQLEMQNVQVLHEKPTNQAAVAIGMGLLAALIFSGKS